MQRAFAAFLAAAALAATGCQQQGSLAGVLATGEPLVTSITVDDGFVYWTRADGTVKKVSLDTGAVTTLGSQHGTTGNLVQDDQNLYWSVDSNLLKIPKAGGTLEVHAQPAPINALTLDDENLYWTAGDNTVNAAAKTGFVVHTLAMSDNPRPILAGTATVTLDWGAEATNGALFQVPLGGGMVDTLLPAGGEILALAQDTDHIYWGTFSTGGTATSTADDSTIAVATGTINMMAPDTSNPQVLATGQNTPLGMMSDASHLYWSNAEGQVMAVSISGGDPQQLVQGPTQCATNLFAPVSIAMDATSIYWANACDDAILTMPRL
jgi:hypothetical protein